MLAFSLPGSLESPFLGLQALFFFLVDEPILLSLTVQFSAITKKNLSGKCMTLMEY